MVSVYLVIVAAVFATPILGQHFLGLVAGGNREGTVAGCCGGCIGFGPTAMTYSCNTPLVRTLQHLSLQADLLM